jgi:zinc transporter ZupT/CRP-like cAMP-binding protein
MAGGGGSGGVTGGEAPQPLVLESFLWGFMSATSLLIGSTIGVTCLPRKQVRAILMAFGGGALLFALSIELFGHALHRSEESGENLPVWTMFASSIAGGLLFAGLNKVLNEHGAAVRKQSTWRTRFLNLRALMAGRMAARLLRVPLFQEMESSDIAQLVQTSMYKEQYRAGDIIVSSEKRNCGLYFVLSGQVRLQISEGGDSMPLAMVKRTRTMASGWKQRVVTTSLDDDEEPGASPRLIRLFKPSPGKIKHVDSGGAVGSTASPDDTPKRSSSAMHTWDIGPDSVFGDMALLKGVHCGMRAMAMESTRVLRIPGKQVMRMVDKSERVQRYVSLRGVENLRQIESLKYMLDDVAETLADKCRLVNYQAGQEVFQGVVDKNSSIISVVFGAIEVTYPSTDARRQVHVNGLLCAEHILGEENIQLFVARAIEATSVVIIDRGSLDSLSLGTNAWIHDDIHNPNMDDITLSDMDDVRRSPRGGPGSKSPHHGSGNTLGQVLPGETTSDIIADVVGAQEGPASGRMSPSKETRASPSAPSKEQISIMGRELGWESEELTSTDVHHNGGRKLSWMPNLGSNMHGGMRSSSRTTTNGRRSSKRKTTTAHEHTVIQEIAGLMTDRDLEDDTKHAGMDRQYSNWSLMSLDGNRVEAIDETISDSRIDANPQDEGHKDHQSADSRTHANGHAQNHAHGHGEGNGKGHGETGSAHAAIMVWLGILIDAVPESLVIGILINKSVEDGGADFTKSAATALPFVIGVFISNLPESMSSSGSMLAHGVGRTKILLMWCATTVVTAVGAALGALLFPPGSSDDLVVLSTISAVEGLAAGAMLTMIAQTMMPEAFEQGGDVVGLSCLAGFLCALSVKLLPLH